MHHTAAISSRPEQIPLPILGIPFDPVTAADAIQVIERMIESRLPHYAVTANVDFVVQAQSDVELRRILADADLVLCDGTPLIWVSHLMGNPLPERVAGADVVPQLLEVAARKRYRVFLLGATPESASRAVENLKRQHPGLPIVGHYSPPFRDLLEMDHAEAVARIRGAAPDLLLVSFGCPKQEKWIAMHYASLGVPISIGVGATIDFLAGQVKRAPAWMQRSGTEWVYRLLQEPRRLFKRYTKDLCVFGSRVLEQCARFPYRFGKAGAANAGADLRRDADLDLVILPRDFSQPHPGHAGSIVRQVAGSTRHCIVDCQFVQRIDPAGIGLLIRLEKVLRQSGRFLVISSPANPVRRAFEFMRLEKFFIVADDMTAARELLDECILHHQLPVEPAADPAVDRLFWRGEITAGNAARVWSDTRAQLALVRGPECVIDLSSVRFVDSSGVDVMLRTRKFAERSELSVWFANASPEVRNVLHYAHVDTTALLAPERRKPARTIDFTELPQARPA